MNARSEDTLISRVAATIDEHRMFDGVSRALIGFSGGPDSVCALDVLHRLYARAIEFELVYVNHGLRSERILRAEEAAVRAHAARYDVPCRIIRIKVPKSALGLEGAAREARYTGLMARLTRTHAQRIVLGHNLDDFVETYLMNMIRGSAAQGLGSIPAIRLPFVRPLIDCPKRDILKYLRQRRLPYATDQTNLSIDRRRNLVRLKVVPLLAKINPDIRGTIRREAQLLKRDDEYVWKAAEKVYARAAMVEKDCITLDRTAILRYNPAITVRLVMKAIANLAGNLDGFESKHYHAVIGLAEKEHGKKIDLPKGLCAEREPRGIAMCRPKPRRNIAVPVDITDGSVSVDDRTLRFRVERAKGKIRPRADREVFDLSGLSLPLFIRNGRPGDRIEAKVGRKKLKKVYSECGIASRKRPEALLLCDQKGILWVIGCARAYRAYVGERTTRVLVVECECTDQRV